MKPRYRKSLRVAIALDDATAGLLRLETPGDLRSVSRVAATLAKEAKRQAMVDWLLQSSGAAPTSSARRAALMAELGGKPSLPKRRFWAA